MKATREQAYQAIDSERDYQMAMAQAAHDDPSNDYTKSLETFATYMRHYQNELDKQLSTCWGPTAYDAPLNTLRKIAALAVAAMEVHGAPKRVAPTPHPELAVGPAMEVAKDLGLVS